MHSNLLSLSAPSPHFWQPAERPPDSAADLTAENPAYYFNQLHFDDSRNSAESSGETRVSDSGQITASAADVTCSYASSASRPYEPPDDYHLLAFTFADSSPSDLLFDVLEVSELEAGQEFIDLGFLESDCSNMSSSPARLPAPASPQVQNKINQYRSTTPGYEKRATSPRPPHPPPPSSRSEKTSPYPQHSLPSIAGHDRPMGDAHLEPPRDLHQQPMSMPRPIEMPRPAPPEIRFSMDVRHGQPHEMRPGPPPQGRPPSPGPPRAPPPGPPGPPAGYRAPVPPGYAAPMDPRMGPSSGHPSPMDRGPPPGAVQRPLQQPLGDTGAPPLIHYESNWGLRIPDGKEVDFAIHARIDKGFELASNQWICYRRNYFSLVGSFALHIDRPCASYEVYSKRGPDKYTTTQFGLGIAAQTDRDHPRPVELVQLTTKRDKGPQGHPPVVRLLPQNFQHHHYSNPEDYVSHAQTVANFERIQFKSATQNNGKRRAAQEFYRLKMVFLAEVNIKDKDGNPKVNSQGRPVMDWIPIANRMTGPLVVRGRSPGHYREEDARALAMMAGDGRSPAVPPMIMPHQGYPMPYGYPPGHHHPYPAYPPQHNPQHPQHNAQPMYHVPALNLPHHNPPRESVRAPSPPLLSEDEKKSIEEPSGYKYYPFALYEAIRDSSRTRPSQSVSPKPGASEEKENLPAIWGGTEQAFRDYMDRKLQRYDAFKTSEGHFPPLRVL